MKPRLIMPLVAALVAGTAGLDVHAEDLGTIGPTYAITETHLLAFIEQRLREKERSGELARLADQARTRGIETVTHPPPVPGIEPTETARSFYFDPSFTLDRNILDAQGHLLFAVLTTGYIFVGVRLEERDLMHHIGKQYESYRARVPMLIPFVHRRVQR